MGYGPGEGTRIEELRLQGKLQSGEKLKSGAEIIKSGAHLGSSIITAVFGIGILYFLFGIVGFKIFSAVNIWIFLGIIVTIILLLKWK